MHGYIISWNYLHSDYLAHTARCTAYSAQGVALHVLYVSLQASQPHTLKGSGIGNVLPFCFF